MTPESKAKKLEYKFFNEFKCWYEVLHNVADVPDKVYLARAKQCAIIAMNEMISLWEEHAYPHPHYGSVKEDLQQVKQAIEKL